MEHRVREFNIDKNQITLNKNPLHKHQKFEKHFKVPRQNKEHDATLWKVVNVSISWNHAPYFNILPLSSEENITPFHSNFM